MLSPDELEESIKKFLIKIRLNEEMISTVLGGLVVLIVGSLIFNYFQQKKVDPAITNEAAFTANFDVSDAVANGKKIYTVKEDDHLWKIAEEQLGDGNRWKEIASQNNLGENDVLVTGQELSLPARGTVILGEQAENTPSFGIYTVSPGDSLRSIAYQVYGDEEEWVKLVELNQLASPDQIEIGMKIKVK